MNKAKKILCLSISVLFLSCGIRINNYYSGIILDELNRPIDSVLVKENFVDEYAVKTFTDHNGFFKMKRTDGTITSLTFSRKGYISDTIPMIWHQYGETTEYSPLITEDSSLVTLLENKNNLLKFKKKILKKAAILDTIIDSNYTKQMLEGIWLKHGVNKLDGLKFDDNVVYLYGIEGNRYGRYNIIKDTLTIFKSFNFYMSIKGIIKKLNAEELKIQWEGNDVSSYKKFQ